jgi:hypothetical protein
MIDPAADQRTRRRAATRLATVLLVVVALAALVTALVIARAATTPPPATTPPMAHVPIPPELGWDLAAEAEIAERPMLTLPVEAAQPRELTTQSAGPDLTLPAPSTVVGRWIPEGFPQTPEGALAQLKALNETGTRGGDPTTYARAYNETALSGAPAVVDSGLHTVLSRFRTRANIPVGEPKPGLAVTYDVTHGLIKGSTDGGRYVVVCTLGQLTFDFESRTTSFGVGDCQAMRWTGTAWRISPGARAAYASSAWPGSLDSVKAGYRALAGGGR